MALQYARNLAQGDNGGLGKFCLDKGNGDPQKAANIMTEVMDSHYKDGFTFQFDTHLNKYMVDFDIKQLLADHVAITSWEDMDEATKAFCFKDYLRKSLPDWDGIVQDTRTKLNKANWCRIYAPVTTISNLTAIQGDNIPGH